MTLLKGRMKGKNERQELCESLEKRRVPLIIVLINRKQRYEVFCAPFALFMSSFVALFLMDLWMQEDFSSVYDFISRKYNYKEVIQPQK